jgi:branched-chain amino acid transport system substrate-binding protein
LNTIRLLLFWLAAVSCAFAQERPAPSPILVGAVISQTGAHAELALEYQRGIELWRDEVNAAGGLLGRRVELRLLDDGSHAVRTGPLYARLIRDDKADLLIGPYGSAATLIAAAEVERARRVMVNGAGSAAAIHGRGPRWLFQSAVPYAAYADAILKVAADAGYRRILLLARDELGSREMAEALQKLAGRDFTVGEIELYRAGTTDFALQVEKARAGRAEAWISFGDVRDAAEMVKTFKRLNYAPALFFARGASHPRFIAFLGQDAEFSLGMVDFDPRLGEAPRAFAKRFFARWNVLPALPAAEGYAAGTVLGAAVRSAGTLEQESVRAALASAEVPTVLGTYKASPQNGAQLGMKPFVVQIRLGRPEAGTPLLPYPKWDERALIK